MTRMQTSALTRLVNYSEAGYFTLPASISEAWRTYQRVSATVVDVPRPENRDAAAARLVAAAAAGESLDPAAEARRSVAREEERRLAEQARDVLIVATEQAAARAGQELADLAEVIITDHLAPAHAAVLDDTRELISAMDGHSRDPHSLLTAPAKVRNAYLRLSPLVERQRVIMDARWKVNNTAGRQAARDVSDLFALFERPMSFHPTWKLPAQFPRLPIPTDPEERLIWLACDPEAQAAGPWLPTIEQQDAAWWALFGEAQEKQSRNQHNARAMVAQLS